MFAAALAAITSFQVVFFGKHDITFRTVIKILRVHVFFKHDQSKVPEVQDSTLLMVQPIDLVSWVLGFSFFSTALMASFR
jgi:hypothetical protein